jgi:hypothetical protein
MGSANSDPKMCDPVFLPDPHTSSHPEEQPETTKAVPQYAPLPSDSNAFVGLAEPEKVRPPPSEGPSLPVPKLSNIEPTDIGPASIAPPNTKSNFRIRDHESRHAEAVEIRAEAMRDQAQKYSQVCPMKPIRGNIHS